MTTVQDELEALRARATVQQQAKTLSTKQSSLSTPEQEEAALKSKRITDRVKQQEARSNLRKNYAAGGDLETQHTLSQRGKKKEEREKKKEAAEILSKFGRVTNGDDEEDEDDEDDEEEVLAIFEKMLSGEGAVDIGNEVVEQGEEVAETESVESNDAQQEVIVDDDYAGDDDDDDNEVPDIQESLPSIQNPTQEQSQAGEEVNNDSGGISVANRSEKKARKIMMRLGMRPLPKIVRVTMKTTSERGGYFFIDRPDVFVSARKMNTATYVVFGEAKQGRPAGGAGAGENGDTSGTAQKVAAAAAAQKTMQVVQTQSQTVSPTAESKDDKGSKSNGKVEDKIDETGVDAKDIELVMSQTSCTRSKAILALRENENDLVNAIMSLTT